MLTGQRTFSGATPADTMSAVLNLTPPNVQSSTHPIPPALQRIVARCLDKEPANRFQNAADLAFALQTVSLDASGAAIVVAPPRPRRWPLAAALVVGAGVLVAAALWWLTTRSSTTTARVLQFEIAPPGPLVNGTGSGGGRFVVSPNGEWIVMRLSDTSGITRLWLRRLSEVTAQPLAGTEGVLDGARPIWSPDGAELAFTTRTELKRIRLADQSVQLIAQLPNPMLFNSRGAWSDAGDILVGDATGRVYRASLTENVVSVLRESPPGILTVVHGFFKGTQKYVAGVRAAGGQTTGELFIESLGDDSRTKISSVSSEARTVGADMVLYQVGNTVYAQRYDLRNNSAIGAATPVVADAALHQFTASDDVLAISPTTANVFRWHDRAGRALGTVSAPGRWGSFDLDSAGTRVVVRDDENAELWVVDTTKGSLERLTFAGGFNNDAAWFPDGRRVAYSRGSGSGAATANSAAIVALGIPSQNIFDDPKGVAIDDISPDGEWVLHHRRGAAALASGEVVARRLNGSESIVVARCRGLIDGARVSDDGRWLAFNCDESSRPEVYVVPFRRDGDRLLVSSAGGMQPKWRNDGRELYFLALDGSVMAASLSEQSGRLMLEVPRPLFKTSLAPAANNDQYGVAGDGQRFLIREPSAATTIRVTVNWRRTMGLAH